jgi:N-acetylglucosaminyldiphosphoundecaprenol N-acetyl-beta-D-mannosaminyltransferase
MHFRELGVPVAAGVGATIDFLAGRVKRAPLWMQKAGLEWIFRLACEPRRLFRRYMKDLWVFGWRMAAQWLMLQGLPRLARRGSRTLAGVLWNATQCMDRHCILDLTGLRFIDSTDLGLLLVLQKKLRAAGRHLVLASPSPGVLRAFALMRLKDHFAVAPDLAAAERVIQERTLEESALVTRDKMHDARGLAWHGEITAANAVEYWNHTRNMLAGTGGATPVAIDLSDVRLIDTSGLTTMLRLQQWAWRQGTKVVFTAAQASVRSVLRMATLDQLLLEKPELSGLIAVSPANT